MIALQDVPLAEWFRAEAPRLNAELAVWAERVAAFDDSREWRGAGIRDCQDWFVVNVGFDRRLADALLRAGRCAQELPVIGAAFASGELSLDKVRSLSTIATAEDQEAWGRTAR